MRPLSVELERARKMIAKSGSSPPLTTVRPRKAVRVGRAADSVKKKRLEVKRCASTSAGSGDHHLRSGIEAAERAAAEVIQIDLDAYREAGQGVPNGERVASHLENPEFRDLLSRVRGRIGPTGRIDA